MFEEEPDVVDLAKDSTAFPVFPHDLMHVVRPLISSTNLAQFKSQLPCENHITSNHFMSLTLHADMEQLDQPVTRSPFLLIELSDRETRHIF